MEDLNLATLAKHFSDESEAWQLVERIRWPNGPICPHCGNDEKSYLLKPRKTRTGKVSDRRLWKCAKCRKQYSVLVGTIFESTHIPLSKWLLGVHMMCAGKNGVSAHELSRQLGITLKSAWFMAHRVRYAMQREPLASKLSGTIEADETYIGGRRRGTSPGRSGPDSHKTPVLSLVSRDGEARSRAVRRVTGNNVAAMLWQNIEPGATLMTDEFAVYRKPARYFAHHETIKHKSGEYARGNVTTNRVEGFFSQLKRSLDGTHHHVSHQHLDRYLAEFDFRFTTRKMTDGERTALTIAKSDGRRLLYQETQAS